MMWGRKKAIQTTSSASSISSFGLNTCLLRFKKAKDRVEPVSDDGFYFGVSLDKERYEKDVILHNSDYRVNLSPVSSGSFKKTAESDGRKMREFIDEDGVKSTVDRSSNQRSKLDSDFETVVEEEWQRLKNMKINEIMLKSEKQRKLKPVDVRKETRRKRSKHRRKVNAFSPRVECRVKALEDMKRTRLKTKEKPVKDAFRTGLDSFAVVKSSFDPQRDFRDSMIEMIIENGIRERDELEELLACYLILNCDEYHHLIIKVFQQVWLELNHFDPYYLADF